MNERRETVIDDLQSTSVPAVPETSREKISRVHMSRYKSLREDDIQERSARDFPIAGLIPPGETTFLSHGFGLSHDILS
jgi:hypothetical protein